MVPELNPGQGRPGEHEPGARPAPEGGQGHGRLPQADQPPYAQLYPGSGPHDYPPQFQPGPEQVFWRALPPNPSRLPVVPREYFEFFRTPRFRWWKPLLSILMFAASWFVATAVVSGGAMFYDLGTGRATLETLAAGQVTPMLFTANNLALGAAIPLSGLAGWAVFGQRPRWISSIVGGFRWGLFARFAAIAAPIFLVGLGVEIVFTGPLDLAWNPDSAFLIVAIVLTTPFQAAGEEYGIRGVLARSIGSWFPARRVGLVVSTVVTSLVFMGLHGAGDPWLNTYYLLVGVACSILVWRTGGLEAAVALHVCNNLVSEISLPFGGLEHMFDRSAGVAGPEILLQFAATAAVTAGMLWLGRRLRLPSATAPGATRHTEPDAGAGVSWTPS